MDNCRKTFSFKAKNTQIGVKNDKRKSFLSEVERFTNLYAYQKGLIAGSYGHKFMPVSIPELARFDGVLIRDGVLGGTDGALHRR